LVDGFNLPFQQGRGCQVEAVDCPDRASDRGGHQEVVLCLGVVDEDGLLLGVPEFVWDCRERGWLDVQVRSLLHHQAHCPCCHVVVEFLSTCDE
jgi:hypothetical protein